MRHFSAGEKGIIVEKIDYTIKTHTSSLLFKSHNFFQLIFGWPPRLYLTFFRKKVSKKLFNLECGLRSKHAEAARVENRRFLGEMHYLSSLFLKLYIATKTLLHYMLILLTHVAKFHLFPLSNILDKWIFPLSTTDALRMGLVKPELCIGTS